jgi:hypothetical protein
MPVRYPLSARSLAAGKACDEYSAVWHLDVAGGMFRSGGQAAAVFRLETDKVLALATRPHAQMAFRFTSPATRS